jgi:hypothetical protein
VRLRVCINENALQQPAVGYGYGLKTEPVHEMEEQCRSRYDQIFAAFFKTGYGGPLRPRHSRQAMKDGRYY